LTRELISQQSDCIKQSLSMFTVQLLNSNCLSKKK